MIVLSVFAVLVLIAVLAPLAGVDSRELDRRGGTFAVPREASPPAPRGATAAAVTRRETTPRPARTAVGRPRSASAAPGR